MKKRFLCLLAVVLSICCLCACAKCIDTKTSIVEVTVKDEYYKDSYYTYVMSGKVLVPIHHNAKYEITVEYCDVEYVIRDKETYNKYKDKIGDVVNGTLETKIYDDGSIKYNIISLE